MHSSVRDLSFKIPNLRIDDTLSSYGISLVRLNVPTNTIETNTHHIPGKVGHIIGKPEMRGSEIKMFVQFQAENKLEYMDKVDTLRYLFSQPNEMVITLRESYSGLYRFHKIGDVPEGVKQFYDRFHVDVIPTGVIVESRSGLTGEFEIQFIFKDVPYRYISVNRTDLSFPTSYNGAVKYYDIFNEGNLFQSGRQFYSQLTMSNLNTKGFTVETIGYSGGEKTTGKLTFAGNMTSSDVVNFNGYMLDVNGVKNMKNTNYGNLHIEPGNNKLIIRPTNNTVIKGFYEFKEYIY